MSNYYCENCKFLEDRSKKNFIDAYCKKYQQSLNFYDWFEKCDKCMIETLQSENAKLQARLDKAVELPCKVGDTVYQYDNAGRIYVSKIKNIVYETNGIAFDKRAINNSIFLTRAEAESRLAELKGEQQ